MIILPERLMDGLISEAAAFKAMEDVFAAMARGEARNYPVIREAIGHADALYGFKSGFDKGNSVLGVKAGGYWPGNMVKGLTNHQSTVLLFDPDTGRLKAAVGGNLLTALRTAAASAVSIKHLARPDARILGMVGAGHQSAYQMRAAVRVRKFEKVIGWNMHPEMLPRLADTAAEIGLPFESVDLSELGAQADVIITITSSFAPTLLSEHVRSGTHLACMGTDTRGKQEVEPALLARARVFADEVEQSITIGEAQHAVAQGMLDVGAITPLGAVIAGFAPGRQSPHDITLFDGTGIALQDLAVASVAVSASLSRGLAQDVEF